MDPMFKLLHAWHRTLLLLICMVLCGAPGAFASHLAIDLTVDGRPHPAHAGTDTVPPENGNNPRPLVHARARDPVKLRWSVKNAEAQKLDTLLVHVFIVREQQAGQKDVPDRKGAMWETASYKLPGR